MKNSSVDTDTLVELVNREKANTLVPAVAFIAVMMVAGLVGNCLTCFFYGFKTKPSPTSIFIVSLAAYDLLNCAVSMPSEIADVYTVYQTTDTGPKCKILLFLIYFASIASASTLVVIAVERYKLICGAPEKRLTVADARRFCVLVTVSGLILSSPAAVVYNYVLVPIPNKYGVDLEAYDCTLSEEKSYQPLIWLSHGVHALIFTVCITLLPGLYAKVLCVIYRNRKRLQAYKHKIAPSATQAKTAQLEIPCNEPSTAPRIRSNQTHENNQYPVLEVIATDTTAESQRSKTNTSLPETIVMTIKPSTGNSRNTETTNVTMVMILVTTVFVVSYIPYLATIIWRTSADKHESEFSAKDLLIYTFGSRSPFVNSCLNPFIYGVFNSKFRQYYRDLFCCRQPGVSTT